MQQALIDLCRSAGCGIMTVYAGGDLSVDTKSDKSPVTAADRLAHEIIVAGITEMTPALPILSEESGNHAEALRGRSRQPVATARSGAGGEHDENWLQPETVRVPDARS